MEKFISNKLKSTKKEGGKNSHNPQFLIAQVNQGRRGNGQERKIRKKYT